MRILEQTTDVLTLQNPARDFWFGIICLLLGGLFGIGLLAELTGGWRLFGVITVVSCFCLALPQIWSSNVVKACTLNQALSKVTVKFHGLQGKTIDFPIQHIQRIEVRQWTSFAYGATLERYQLWLVTRNSATTVPLSEEYHRQVVLEAMADRIREFLSIYH